VTGAAGSIGSALVEELAMLGCSQLVLVDQHDHGLIDITERVSRLDRKIEVVDLLCDVRDRERLVRRFESLRPEIVIHAAALKHVHMGERHPGACVLTNFVGTCNALAAAHAGGASHFTLVSSDKAAAPVCVMGATKRLAELYLLSFQRERAPAMSIKSARFGNVIGTQGSVVPRFLAQIDSNGPLQITHPDMERYFMSVENAIELILSITETECPSGTYFKTMGDMISILAMGREMIARSGRSIEIEFTGLRPGEKLKETLHDEYELVRGTGSAEIFRVEALSLDTAVTSHDVAALERLARRGEDAIVRQHVFALLDACLGRDESAVG
jgi:O-antigen biosynthesis protein WbqV